MLLLEVLLIIDSTVIMIALMIMRPDAIHNATSISCGGSGVALSNEHLSSYSNDDLDSGGL